MFVERQYKVLQTTSVILSDINHPFYPQPFVLFIFPIKHGGVTLDFIYSHIFASKSASTAEGGDSSIFLSKRSHIARRI